MKSCRKCQKPLQEGELFCPQCGTEQEDDLFAAGSFSTPEPEPQIAAPPPRPVIQKPVEATLELDVKDACAVCGNALRTGDEKAAGKCVQHMPVRRASVRTQVPKELPKKRNVAPIMLAIVAVAIVAAALILRSRRSERPEPPPVAMQKPETPKIAADDAASLGRKLAADPEDSAEVAEYVAASGSHPRSDGNAEYAAMEALLDDTTERSPEETAKARAALMGVSPNSAEQMKKIQALASKNPGNAVVADALAESKLRLDPRAAFAKEMESAGKALGRVKGLMLAARGEVEQATVLLREEAKKDPVAAHDLRVLLAQSGRCKEAEALLTDDGSIGAVLERAEHRVACQHDAAGARTVLDAARDQQGMKPTKRASLNAAAALASLDDDKEREPRCSVVTDASVSALTNEAFLRCALIKADTAGLCGTPSTSKNDWIAVAQSFVCKKANRTKLTRVWDPAAAMLGAVAKLTQKKPPLAALDEAAPSLLFSAWDGAPGYPITRAELNAVAKLAPAKTWPVSLALAAALVGEPSVNTPAPLKATLAALVAYREGKALPTAPPTTKLGRFIKAAAKKDKKALAKQLKDPSFGPFAFVVLQQLGALSTAEENAAKRMFVGHPALRGKASH